MEGGMLNIILQGGALGLLALVLVYGFRVYLPTLTARLDLNQQGFNDALNRITASFEADGVANRAALAAMQKSIEAETRIVSKMAGALSQRRCLAGVDLENGSESAT